MKVGSQCSHIVCAIHESGRQHYDDRMRLHLIYLCRQVSCMLRDLPAVYPCRCGCVKVEFGFLLCSASCLGRQQF